jgi:AcrR family transcriptional regulator
MPSTTDPGATRRRGQGGRPPSTTHARIVQAALSIARVNGLAAVSLRSVAEHVGVHQTSLYNYFDSKEHLLQAMLDYLFEQDLVLPGPDDPRGPVDQLKDLTRDARRVCAEHVELLALAGSTPTSETGGRWTASGTVFALLGRLGLSPAQQTRVCRLLYQLMLANALLVGNQRRSAHDGIPPSGPADPVLPDETLPGTARALKACGPITPDAMFEDTLTDVFDIYLPALLSRSPVRPD